MKNTVVQTEATKGSDTAKPVIKYSGVAFRALTIGGKPHLDGVTMMSLPNGVDIVGNGTLSHPLNVKLSAVYAFAPAMAELVAKIARLNPDCAEIGAGMLANLVSEARNIESQIV